MDNNYIDKENSTLLIQKQLNKGVKVNDCLIPYFCNNDPYQYIICYRINLESKDVNIEDWINLVFGEYSYGKKQKIKEITITFI